MTSLSPPSFTTSDHYYYHPNPKLKLLNHHHHYKSSSSSLNSSNILSHSKRSLSNSSSLICRCQNNTNGNGKSNGDDDDVSGWDKGIREGVGVVVKWFDDCVNGFRINSNDNYDDDDVDMGEFGDADVEKGEWDWERWKKHFVQIDEQEKIVSILQSQLKRAVVKEDYEDAARIKVAIAAAATNDTVGRVMAQLNKAIKEERYKDASFIRDYASAGLVGWWAGFSDDSKDPYGRIIRISAEHGRYLAKSYSPRQLAKAADGAPLFELFITMNEKGEYKHRAVYLKRGEGGKDFPLFSSKSSGLINTVGPLDSMGNKGDIFIEDKEDTDDGDDIAEETGFGNTLRDMIPGAKDVKIKVMNVTSPGKLDRDLISKLVEQIMEEDESEDDESESEEDEDDDAEEEEDDTDEVKDETDVEQYDIDIDIDTGNTMLDGEANSQIAVKVVVGGLVQKVSNDISHEDLIRVPAKLEKKTRSSFTFSIEKEKQQLSSDNEQSLRQNDVNAKGNRSIDSVMLDLAKHIGKGKIPMKVLKDVNQLISLSLSQAQNRQPLSGSTTFNRIELPSTRDPLNGLYVGAHGIYTSEVIQLKRKFGQWQKDVGMKEFSNVEFYEYVEAVKITGDPYVPAGQVAFRAKIGTKYQLPHRGIIPEEFGVIARYRGQGRLADSGFKNPRWVDGELVILDGKYINGGPVVGFVYWAPESHYLVFFNQLKLQ